MIDQGAHARGKVARGGIQEAAFRRRMMSISAHDRISGSPQMVHVWDDFISYAKCKPGVVFMRKDEIARFAVTSPLTLREDEAI